MPADRNLFDSLDQNGRFRGGSGTLQVQIVTRDEKRHPGRLHFHDGLCHRIELDGGGNWELLERAPLNGIRLRLAVGDGQPVWVLIDHGRIEAFQEPGPGTRHQFLSRLRTARNFFAHPSQLVNDDRPPLWLTPRTVAGFDANDFPELGREGRERLTEAVRAFSRLASEAASGRTISPTDAAAARTTFEHVLACLKAYLQTSDEERAIATALSQLDYPPWIVNWDFELGRDSEGDPVVWLDLFADESRLQIKQLGRIATDMTLKSLAALDASGIARRPHVRMHTAAEYQTTA